MQITLRTQQVGKKQPNFKMCTNMNVHLTKKGIQMSNNHLKTYTIEYIIRLILKISINAENVFHIRISKEDTLLLSLYFIIFLKLMFRSK